MIEKTVLQYLNSALPCPVYMEIPAKLGGPQAEPVKPAGTFVLLEKTGSGRSDHINRATLAIQSWADSLLAAAQLNEQVKGAMDNLTELDEIGACRLNTDYNFTDPTTKRYRYQAVYDVTYY